MYFFAAFLVVVNTIALTAMYIDKCYAKRKSRKRISESRLISFALLGGSLGALIGMNLFRHKTKHIKFKFGLPTIFTLHILLVYLYIK